MKMIFATRCNSVITGLLVLGFQIGVSLAKEQEEFHQTYALNENGQVRLDNVNGKVVITAWDHPEIKVDALKRADNQADLDALKIEITSKPGKIKIHTVYPKWKASQWRKSNSATVDYEIKVPAQAVLDDIQSVNGDVDIEGVRGHVNASTVNGRLTAKGLNSDSRLESVNGTVEATFEKLDNAKTVSLKSVNGKLKLMLPTEANAEVSANTLNGGIHADSALTVKKRWPVGTDLNGTLGKGGTKIKLETVNGGIQVHRSDMVQPVSAEKP